MQEELEYEERDEREETLEEQNQYHEQVIATLAEERNSNRIMKQNGTVKWFSAAKGYGFISQADGAADLFVHFSEIEMEGYKKLDEGDRVEFDVARGPKGLQATGVRVI